MLAFSTKLEAVMETQLLFHLLLQNTTCTRALLECHLLEVCVNMITNKWHCFIGTLAVNTGVKKHILAVTLAPLTSKAAALTASWPRLMD